jgi:mRNA-degrading endonuclease HigB of HigAB toxin-antitoxin module
LEGAKVETKKLEKALKSIGKKSFVEDYEIYSNQDLSLTRKIEILSKKYSRNGATIRVSFAEMIFQYCQQQEALEIIINSPRVTSDIKTQARRILMGEI